MSEFEELAAARAGIKKFLVAHQTSVESFYDQTQQIFNILVGEERAPDPTKKVRGLTSTFTCLESLVEAGPVPLSDKDLRDTSKTRLLEYTKLALSSPDDWYSEGSAWIYCRVRSLGAVARHTPESMSEHVPQVRQLLNHVLNASDWNLGGAYGIRELNDRPDAPPHGPEYSDNAYLTYWALYVAARAPKASLPKDFPVRQKALTDWMVRVLGEQISFHDADSPHADPQQLAWAIGGVVLSSQPGDLVKNARKYDLIDRGLAAFFGQQHPRGDWDRGKPLFNYLVSGNAYCYSYETLAEMLAMATDRDIPAGRGFADLLRPYWKGLTRAFEYARTTALPLGKDPLAIGWGSGHQPRRLKPESWATASVFRFAERLRVLLGRWTSSEAMALLDARPSRKSWKELESFGATWNTGHGSAGAQLACFWTLPVLAGREVAVTSVVGEDPDELVIPSTQGRSAILYGPPGTGKTTMVEAVAGILGWPFIEITPAQFLDQGLDRVSARADEIFRQMMELDRCVVLLDEIDELIQNRTEQAEALERFFTTTMLPRLAKLWDMGKIMFFANTNNVLDIDSAVRRSQRFDAAILVLPPGQKVKAGALKAAGTDVGAEILSQLETLREPESSADISDIVWYALARHDQLGLLAERARVNGTSKLSREALAEVVQPIGQALMIQDWSNSVSRARRDYKNGGNLREPTADSVSETKRGSSQIVEDLRRLVQAQRRSPQMMPVIKHGGKVSRAERVGTTEYWKLQDPEVDIENRHWGAGKSLTAGGQLA